MHHTIRTLFAALLALTATALAHETQLVGEGDAQYKVIVGYAKEPAYTDERNGLDLFIRTAADEPVPNLASSLTATLIAPDGATTRQLALRGVHGQPDRYTADFILTQPGAYQLHLTGFIGALEIDLTFTLHDVGTLSELRFP